MAERGASSDKIMGSTPSKIHMKEMIKMYTFNAANVSLSVLIKVNKSLSNA